MPKHAILLALPLAAIVAAFACSSSNGASASVCSQLASCCGGLPTEEQEACSIIVQADSENACAEELASYSGTAGCGVTGSGSEQGSTVTSDESVSFSQPSHDESSDGNSNDSSDEDESDSGDGESTYPECTTYADTYCDCLGSIAASDCVPDAESGCNEIYSLEPGYFQCLINAGCSYGGQCSDSS